MHETVVLEPQRKIATARGLRSLQFGEHRLHQFGIALRRLRPGLVPDHGSFHGWLLSWAARLQGRLTGTKGFSGAHHFLLNNVALSPDLRMRLGASGPIHT